MFAGFRASVVGTRFVIRHDDNDSGVAVQVTEGAVRVDQADDPYALPGDTLTMVRAGNRWQYAGGRMALEPIPAVAPIQALPAAQVEPVVAPVVAEPVVAPEAAAVPVAARAVARPTDRAAVPVVAEQPSARPYNFPAATALQPHAIVIEVPPQQMPPPEQMPIHPSAPGHAETPGFER